MAVSQPDFIEVSNIYKRQYAYLNEKMKFIYFDFIVRVYGTFRKISKLRGV